MHAQPDHRRRSRRSAAGRGFTLIELLVVVAIISLLISITTPSLSRARQQAKATHCLTRMSEFMKGLTAYSADYDFQLPPARYEVKPHTGIWHGWAESLYQELYRDDDYEMDRSFPVQRNDAGRFDLWVCKEAQPTANSTGHYRVYETSWVKGNMDRVKLRLPLIMDANPSVTFSEDLERSDVPSLRLAGLEGEAYIDERHYGGANYAFPDGHAERSTNLKKRLAEDWDLDADTPNR